MIDIFYWVLLLIWLVLGIRANYTTRDFYGIAGSLVVFLLFVLAGLKIFGNPLH